MHRPQLLAASSNDFWWCDSYVPLEDQAGLASSCPGHSAAVEAPWPQPASDPRCCGLQLKPQTRLLPVPLGMANAPGNTQSDCACDVIWCQAVIRSLLVLSDLGAVSLSCPWFIISLDQQLHLCFVQCRASAADRYAVWLGVLVWLCSECPQLSPCAACCFGPQSSSGACRLRPF